MATELNEQLSEIHADSDGRLYGFGTLPLQDPAAAEREVHRMAALPGIRGIIIGTTGRGFGLEDPELAPVWSALEAHDMVAFIHPHVRNRSFVVYAPMARRSLIPSPFHPPFPPSLSHHHHHHHYTEPVQTWDTREK